MDKSSDSPSSAHCWRRAPGRPALPGKPTQPPHRKGPRYADPKYWPRQRGVDYQYGPLIGEIDYFTHEQHGVLDWYRDNKPLNENGYSTTLLGNAAVKLINEHAPTLPPSPAGRRRRASRWTG